MPYKTRKYLDVRYDVTALSTVEVSELAREASAQAESNGSHRSVPVELERNDVEVEIRTVIVQFTVEVVGDDLTAEEVGAYLDDALIIGMEGHTGGESMTARVTDAQEQRAEV